jgi:metal-dependent amidase/aminoacylase/carboxypeptidase family protein
VSASSFIILIFQILRPESHPMPHHYYHDKHGSVGAAGARLVAKHSKLAEYKGRTAHPAANPWDGVNALDAVVAGYNNVSLMRQQMHPTQRVHCAIIDTPKRTNIIAGQTAVAWQCRSPKMDDLRKLTERLCSCLHAGALATGCQLDLKEWVPFPSFHHLTAEASLTDI